MLSNMESVRPITEQEQKRYKAATKVRAYEHLPLPQIVTNQEAPAERKLTVGGLVLLALLALLFGAGSAITGSENTNAPEQ